MTARSDPDAAPGDGFSRPEPSRLLAALSHLPGLPTDASREHRLLAGLVAVLIPLAVAITTVISIGGGEGLAGPGVLVGMTATAGLVGTYAVANRGAVDLAAVMALAIAFGGCVGVVMLPTALPDPIGYAFFAVPLAMSSVLMPAGTTAILTGLAVALAPSIGAPGFQQTSLGLAMVMVGGLLTLGSHLRNQDQRRIEAQAESLATVQTWFGEAQRIGSLGAFTWTPGEPPWWSSGVYRILGYEPGTITASLSVFQEHVHPEDRARFEETLINAINDPSAGALEVRMIRADGETVDTEWRTEVLADGHGGPRYVGVVQDVTDRKRYEALMRQASGEQARTQTLEHVVLIASHEFREPTRTVITGSQEILKELPPDLRDRVETPLARVLEAGDRLEEVTDGLVRFTESLARPLDPQPVAVSQLLDDALAQLNVEGQATEVRIQAGDLPRVEADPGFLRQVLAELIRNAAEHADGCTRIRVSASRAGSLWELVVADDGCGIDAEYWETVFEPFRRLERDGYAEHAGLGLARVDRIIERHGGHVEIREAPSGGTEVALTLPPAAGPVLDLDGPATVEEESEATTPDGV